VAVTDDDSPTLLGENARLRAQVADLESALAAALALVAQLQARLATLERPPPPPPFVKPNTPRAASGAPRPRRPRAAAQNHGRPRATPTEVRTHAYAACPICAYPLHGQSIARHREVLDLPAPAPVRVIDYQVLKRYCPHCARWREPPLILDDLVLGHGRFSARVLALVAWLRTALRLPVRQIQAYLAHRHGLQISVGALCALLARVAAVGERPAQAIKAALQASAVLHVDETSWRENGQNGYVWVLTNAVGGSYFHYDRSRAGAVARRLTGAAYAGTLCTDFYAGYNAHPGRHQRCWAHLLRDLADLETAHPDVATVTAWVGAVRALYQEGAAWAGRAPPASAAAREAAAAGLRARAHVLGLQGAQGAGDPTQVLGQRLLRHEGELFEFVRQAEVAATNNAAERVIRPLAVARKISGGTRSGAGSTTRMRLQTLFTTWASQGRDPLQACLEMLGAQTPLPSS
jgi:transposase